MSLKGKKLECPCCGARLQVDPLRLEILGWEAPPGGPPPDLEERLRAAAARGEEARDAFASALDAERRREEELDDLFQKARDRLRKRQGEDEPPENPLDDKWR